MTSSNQTYKHWQLNRDDNNILWLYFDKQDSRANTIDREVLDELDHILQNLSSTKSPIGIVITSGKESGFIAGADIDSFSKLKSIEEAKELVRRGQIVFEHLEDLTIPTVALINGFCLGGGLELALACRYQWC